MCALNRAEINESAATAALPGVAGAIDRRIGEPGGVGYAGRAVDAVSISLCGEGMLSVWWW